METAGEINLLARSEASQALARSVIVSLIALYLGGLVSLTEQPQEIVRIGAWAGVYCPVSWVWWNYVRRRPLPFEQAQWRIYAGIFADVAMIGVFISIGGPEVLPIYIVYLWVIMGNGMRFGEQTMFAATFASVVSLSLAALVSPRWVMSPVPTTVFACGLLIVNMFGRRIIRQRDEAMDLVRRLTQELQEARLDVTEAGIMERTAFLSRVDQELEELRDGSVLAAIVIHYDSEGAARVSNPHSDVGRLVARNIASELRGSDIATFGSEHEVWLLIEPKRQSDAQAVASRVSRAIASVIQDIRTRMGIAIYPMVQADAEGLFEAARADVRGPANPRAKGHLSVVDRDAESPT